MELALSTPKAPGLEKSALESAEGRVSACREGYSRTNVCAYRRQGARKLHFYLWKRVITEANTIGVSVFQ